MRGSGETCEAERASLLVRAEVRLVIVKELDATLDPLGPTAGAPQRRVSADQVVDVGDRVDRPCLRESEPPFDILGRTIPFVELGERAAAERCRSDMWCDVVEDHVADETLETTIECSSAFEPRMGAHDDVGPRGEMGT